MKANARVIVSLIICLLSVALFIFLVAIKDRINGILIFLYPILLGVGCFGVGLMDNLKAGLRLGLTFLIFIFVFGGIGELCNSVLKTEGIIRIISLVAGLAGAYYAARLAYMRVLPKLLKIHLKGKR